MMESRRCASAMRPSAETHTPASSGPRCRIVSAIERASPRSWNGLCRSFLLRIPAMPHTPDLQEASDPMVRLLYDANPFVLAPPATPWRPLRRWIRTGCRPTLRHPIWRRADAPFAASPNEPAIHAKPTCSMPYSKVGRSLVTAVARSPRSPVQVPSPSPILQA